MQIYLPIAEISLDAFLLLGLGGLIGFLSGLFGVGGGFLMTPALIFIGVPPPVAVGTEANQIVASSSITTSEAYDAQFFGEYSDSAALNMLTSVTQSC